MLIVKSHRKLLLNLTDPNMVTTVIPTAKVVRVRGQDLVAVPHMEDEVRVLRNLGIDAPAPMASYYDYPGKYKPFIHQRTTAEFLTMNPRAFCLNGMGSGKTLAALWAFDYLRKAGVVDWMFVISPLSTLERAWADEIFSNFFDMTFTVLHGTREKRHKLLQSKRDVYIINHDGFKNPETIRLIDAMPGRGLFVIDEIAEFSNATTERWRVLNHLVNPKVEGVVGGVKKMVVKPRIWVWGMTGTPIPNAPPDAWAQVKLISPSRVPGYFGKFRDTVMTKISNFKYAPKQDSLSTVKHVMQPSIRFSREECVDLPPTTYVTRQTVLTPEQDKAYKDMLRSMKAQHDGQAITAVNAAVMTSKLIQICCGVAYGVNGEVVIPARDRVELVKEIIRGSEGKVLVFAPLTGALNALATDLHKDFTTSVVQGATSKADRDDIFRRFQHDKDPHVLVANAGTMSHGLSFTAASTIVWFAPGNSNRTRMQANERMAWPGQTKNMLIVNIAATPLERKMYARMDDKESMQDVLLELFKEMR